MTQVANYEHFFVLGFFSTFFFFEVRQKKPENCNIGCFLLGELVVHFFRFFFLFLFISVKKKKKKRLEAVLGGGVGRGRVLRSPYLQMAVRSEVGDGRGRCGRRKS